MIVKRIIVVLLLIAGTVQASAQSCTIQAGALKVCLGGTITFTPSISDSAYLWTFGNGSTSTQAIPTYQYPQAGTYQVNLTVYRAGGAVCQAAPVQIRVFHKPVARYTLQTARQQCFRNNNFVFADSSIPGLDQAPIRKRVFVFDDGAIVQQNAPYAPVLSHAYSNTGGDKYRVVMEITDTNGCIDQFIDSVVVFPRREDLILTATQQVGCNETKVTFKNVSLYDSTNSANIWWLVDSNVTLTGQWRTIEYTYTGNRDAYPRLVIEDRNGCKDTTELGFPVFSFIPDSTIHILASDKSCFRNNDFIFYDSTVVGTLAWTVTDERGGFVTNALGKSFRHSFHTCGLYNIHLDYQFSNCHFKSDTQVYVYGPGAVIANDTIAPVNWVQCTSGDTVRFNRPDVNCRYQNKHILYLWNFDDGFAPPCTTDTRNGINVGMNCNYSIDTGQVPHHYSRLNDNCYQPVLLLMDTVLNCFDSDSVFLRLAPPRAGWDSAYTPPRPRVYTTQSACSNRVTFFFDRLLPRCGPELVWLLPDSACPLSSWIQVDSMGLNRFYQHVYLTLCDSTGNITYGVVVSNGANGSGQRCYDTTWYHLKLQLPVKFNFTYELQDNDLCSPHNYRFVIPDSIRKDVNEMVWDFGDGSPLLRIPFGPADSVMRAQEHLFMKDGTYAVTLIVEGKNGCISSLFYTIDMGKNVVITNPSARVCTSGFAEITAEITYRSLPFKKFWDDTTRRNSGKEQLYWNFGDDTTWVPGREVMRHKYKIPGVFQVKIAYKDSMPGSCFDSLATPAMRITVQEVKARIHALADTFYCAPSIVSFVDSSYTRTDTVSRQYNIFKREWNFGPERPISTLADPSVVYGSNGRFRISLYAESIYGCFDQAEDSIVIIGPQPKFIILTDTFGCAPVTFRFKNQTGTPLKNWIWYFNDQAQTFLSTKSDSDVSFTYTQPGVYKIDLLGEEDIFNPVTGTFKNCTSKFPFVDAFQTFHSRQVVALKTDTLSIISPDTVCEDQVFLVQGTDSSFVRQVTWRWGDFTQDSVAAITDKAGHIYDSSGTYLLRIDPVITNPWECVVGAEKNILVRKPEAAFSFDLAGFPNIAFKNESVNAVRYVWDFGQPLYSSNNSTEVNPVHTITPEPREIVICLMAFDVEGCMDSVCKPLPLRASVKIPNVFTPGNNDGRNDAFDIEIEGWIKYQLSIYNRWGTLVFQGFKDGFFNDGVNWDGRDKNNGSDCPEGVYYVVFTYRLVTEPEEKTYHGTVTLIRDDD